MSRRNQSGEWTKTRRDLWTHPKVRRIAMIIGAQWQPELPLSAPDKGPDNVRTNILVHAVVSGLSLLSLTVNRHASEAGDGTDDAILSDIVTDNYLDEVSGLAGIQAAMIAVGWAEHDKAKGVLRLRNYLQHNALHKGERRAGRPGNPDSPDAIRKREARAKAKADKGADNPPDNPPSSDGQKADKPAEQSRAEHTVRERESSAPAGDLALQADSIAADYPKADSPLDVRRVIVETLQRGAVTADEMRAKVRRCVAAIRQAPGGVGNRFVPKALTFFAEEQWADPEAFEGRWREGKETGAGSKANGRPVVLTTEKKGGF